MVMMSGTFFLEVKGMTNCMAMGPLTLHTVVTF